VEDLFGSELENLDSVDVKSGLQSGEDTQTSLHNRFYEKVNSGSGWRELQDIYMSFLRHQVCSMFEDEVFMVQRTPNIRFSRPGAKAVYNWHSDGDALHGHPPGEINIYLPLTDSCGSATIWVESLPGLGDFAPVDLHYGQVLIAYLNRCRHGNVVNSTGQTRVSFDFRVVPWSAYDPMYPNVTATTKQRFIEGEYYSRLEVAETGRD
jgi:hypothetical protein